MTLRHHLRTAIALLVLAAAVASPAAADWTVDAAHTEVNFSVRHFFTPVSGRFTEWDVELAYDPADLSATSVRAEISVASVDTNNDRRDDHLRSADWFEVDTHPTLTFESTRVERVSDDELVAHGNLTIKGITREIELPITVLGVKEIPAGMQEMLGGAERVASFRASTTIDRRDFAVGTGSWAETTVVGADVDIEILLEAHDK